MAAASQIVVTDTPEKAVRGLRAGLIAKDPDRVQAHRWLAPRPPAERDLFSDLAAAEGLTRAVKKLSRFWGQAEATLERIRYVSGCEAEVYERVVLPSETLSIVSVTRRESPDHPWKVVCTNEASDDRLVIWLAVWPTARVDDSAWTHRFVERYGAAAELVLAEEASGVIGHPVTGWLANVRGPFPAPEWPENLPGEGDHIVELTLSLSDQVGTRADQIGWALRCASVLQEHLGADAAYLPSHRKLLPAQALARAAETELDGPQTFHLWARVEHVHGYFVTSGLSQLGLPEIEVPEAVAGERARGLVEWLGALVAGGFAPVPGTELVGLDGSLQLVGGRRGPRLGRSYGRWGAVGVGPLDTRDRRGSRTRIRIPEDL